MTPRSGASSVATDPSTMCRTSWEMAITASAGFAEGGASPDEDFRAGSSRAQLGVMSWIVVTLPAPQRKGIPPVVNVWCMRSSREASRASSAGARRFATSPDSSRADGGPRGAAEAAQPYS